MKIGILCIQLEKKIIYIYFTGPKSVSLERGDCAAAAAAAALWCALGSEAGKKYAKVI